VFAEDATDCERKCDRERSFTCRAFAFANKRCLLSADDAPALAESKPPSRTGHVYGEKHCVSEHCSNGLCTYEKVTGHVLRTASTDAITLPKQSSSIGITADCRVQCDADPLNCPAFQVNYLSARCDRLDRNSQGRQLELIERDGESYFERVCLRVPAAARSSCRDKLWTFERVLGYELAHGQYERALEHVLSRRDCEEFCLQEPSFSCRSALYDDESALCRLSRHDRRSRPSAFIRNNNLRISYLENQCAPPARLCPYQATSNAYPTYTDLVVNVTGTGKGEQSACESRCNQSREFLCRSFAFYPSTGECFLSGDDTLSGYLSAISSRSAMHYQERKCTARHELMPEPDDQQLDAAINEPSTAHPAPVTHRPHDRTSTGSTADLPDNRYSPRDTDRPTLIPTHKDPASATHSYSDTTRTSSMSTVSPNVNVEHRTPNTATSSSTIEPNDSRRHQDHRWNGSVTGLPNLTDRTSGSIESPIQTSTESEVTGTTHDSHTSTHPGRRGWATDSSTSGDSTQQAEHKSSSITTGKHR
jgi:hypothetical protein